MRSLFPVDTILYPATRIPTYSTQLQGDLRILEFWERWQLVSSNIEKCHQLTVTKKRNRIPTSYTLHNQTLERVTSAKYLELELMENFHGGETHPVNCCKCHHSERLCIQEAAGMPTCCPDILLQRPHVSPARVGICGVGPPSATSEVHIRDGATTVSPPHPS